MSRRNDGFFDTLIWFLVFWCILGAIIGILKFLVENIIAVAIVLVVIILIALVVFALVARRNK